MKKIILCSMVTFCSLIADVKAPEVLTKNNFETAEYQLFVTNTQNILITEDMTKNVVYQGTIKKYYQDANQMLEKRFNVGEEIGDRINAMNQQFGQAVYYKDIKSLQNIGVATVGSIALNAMLGPIFGDKTYIQVVDYYKDDKPQTRIIKYLVSDDGLDKEEQELAFLTTDDQSYHFRSGGFQTLKYKLKD